MDAARILLGTVKGTAVETLFHKGLLMVGKAANKVVSPSSTLVEVYF